jgi:hypothetical protein
VPPECPVCPAGAVNHAAHAGRGEQLRSSRTCAHKDKGGGGKIGDTKTRAGGFESLNSDKVKAC